MWQKHSQHSTLCFPTRDILFQDAVYDSRACKAPNHCNRSRIWRYTDQPFEQACQSCLASRFLDSSLYTQKTGGNTSALHLLRHVQEVVKLWVDGTSTMRIVIHVYSDESKNREAKQIWQACSKGWSVYPQVLLRLQWFRA